MTKHISALEEIFKKFKVNTQGRKDCYKETVECEFCGEKYTITRLSWAHAWVWCKNCCKYSIFKSRDLTESMRKNFIYARK